MLARHDLNFSKSILIVTTLKVHYADSVGVARGSVTGDMVEIALNNYEFITTVEGTFNGSVITRIAFETNKGESMVSISNPTNPKLIS